MYIQYEYCIVSCRRYTIDKLYLVLPALQCTYTESSVGDIPLINSTMFFLLYTMYIYRVSCRRYIIDKLYLVLPALQCTYTESPVGYIIDNLYLVLPALQCTYTESPVGDIPLINYTLFFLLYNVHIQSLL